MTSAPEVVLFTHGELDCADAEAILHETTSENVSLRKRLADALDHADALEAQAEMLRLEGDRLRALLDDVSVKNAALADERDGLIEQVKLVHEELSAIEGEAVPEGTLLFATLTRDDMVAEYRRASRINRGPLPPSVLAAVDAAGDQIVEAMTLSGQEVLNGVIRREVRRRRRAATRATTRTTRATRR